MYPLSLIFVCFVVVVLFIMTNRTIMYYQLKLFYLLFSQRIVLIYLHQPLDYINSQHLTLLITREKWVNFSLYFLMAQLMPLDFSKSIIQNEIYGSKFFNTYCPLSFGQCCPREKQLNFFLLRFLVVSQKILKSNIFFRFSIRAEMVNMS